MQLLACSLSGSQLLPAHLSVPCISATMAGSTAHWERVVQVLARHRLSGTAMMTVRRPGDCNYFTDPGCDISRPNKQFSETQLQVRVPARNCSRRLSSAICS